MLRNFQDTFEADWEGGEFDSLTSIAEQQARIDHQLEVDPWARWLPERPAVSRCSRLSDTGQQRRHDRCRLVQV